MANEWDFTQQGEFDANKVEPLPAGEYTAVIIDTEERKTKSGTGKYLWLKLEIVSDPGRGRHVHDNLNLDNPNAKAVEIARATLSSICRAVGVLTPKSSAELRNKPLLVKLGIEPARGDYPESNRVKGYKAVAGTQPLAKIGTPTFTQEAEKAASQDVPF